MGYVYDFDHAHPRAPMELKDLLGGKGANLAEMTSVLGLPVPHGFTISTDACRAYMSEGWPAGLDAEVAEHLTRLEERMGRRLGDPDDPLLVSVRSGAKFSMPGMMDTVLNLGLNDRSVEGLAKQTSDERFAFDSYRRFVQMYGRIVLGVPGEELDGPLEALKERTGASDAELPAAALAGARRGAEGRCGAGDGRALPAGADRPASRRDRGRVRLAGTGPEPSPTACREHIPNDLGTAVNVQAMVFGNRDDKSGTGVGFTRDPATGAKGAYGDFLDQRPGRGRGRRYPQHRAALGTREQVPRDLRGADGDLRQARGALPGHVRHGVHDRAGQALDAADPRGQAHRPRPRCAWQWTWSTIRPSLSRTPRRVQRTSAEHIEAVLHPQFADNSLPVLAKGLAASPGAAVGAVCFTADDAAVAAANGRASDPRAQRDLPRGRARHARRRGHPDRAGEAW